MKTIVITSPDHWPGEETVIPRLLEAGVDFVHLRKPAWSEADCARLLSLVPAWCHGRIVVHDHFVLCRRFSLRGIHLNGRCPEIPVGFEGAVSRSCHSLCEVEEGKPLSSYVFLSPVFDSISKPGTAKCGPPGHHRQARGGPRRCVGGQCGAAPGLRFRRRGTLGRGVETGCRRTL